MTAANDFLAALLRGDAGSLAARFDGEPVLDDPRLGEIRGRAALEWYVAETAAWLAAWEASLEPVGEIVADPCQVGEAVLHLAGPEGSMALPVAVVVEGRETWRAVRVYHSMWPLTRGHRIRPPLLSPRGEVRLPDDAVGEYQRALAAGDLERVLAVFEPEAVVREPAGPPYVYRGGDEIRGIYQMMFANGGGIPLQHCSLIDDGTASAIEYNVARWGATVFPPQAGVAVYVRGSGGGLVVARIYDDVAPPPASDTSDLEENP